MTNKKLIPLFITLLIISFFALSPFLPGPSFLSEPAKFFYSAALLLSMFGILILPVGLWLTVGPLTLIICIFLSYPLRNISRSIAIKRASKIIEAIEAYRNERNEYPKNLNNLQPKYLKVIPSSFIIGIPNYQYQYFDSSYSLTFEQEVLFDLNYEVVTYYPFHENQADGETLETGFKHWSYYIFD